jgi:transcription elongation factor Elf1
MHKTKYFVEYKKKDDTYHIFYYLTCPNCYREYSEFNSDAANNIMICKICGAKFKVLFMKSPDVFLERIDKHDKKYSKKF